jgi:guanylate kinase
VADHADLALSVSATTRAPRPGEVDGREYHYVDRAAIDAMVAGGEFLEWAEVHDHRYGSPRAPIMAALDAGKDVLFDIDWQGADQIVAAAPEDSVRVFILPPSMADLARRLHARAQDRQSVIESRLARAYGEIEQAANYDYVVVNEDFDRAYADLAHIYHGERLRRARNPWTQDLAQALLAEKL